MKLTKEQAKGLRKMAGWYMMRGLSDSMMFDYVKLGDNEVTYHTIAEWFRKGNIDEGSHYGEKEKWVLNELRKHYLKNKQ